MHDGHFQLMFEHQHTAMVLLDERRKIITINPAAESLLGQSAQRTHGKLVDQVCTFLDLSALKYLKQQRVIHRNLVLDRPHKKPVPVDLAISPIDDNMSLLEIYPKNTLLDGHQNKSSDHSPSENLLRGLAHEIKNPLGGIRGAAQLLEGEFKDSELKEYTEVIIAETDRLTALIDRVLGPNQQPVKTWLNIHEILERVCILLEAQSEDNIEIHRDYDVSIPEVQVDRDQMVQAVLNIASNARDSIAAKGGKITFSSRILRNHIIQNSVHPLVVSLAVVDNGPGISAEFLPDIFFPMISNKPEGSGLGLSISQALVKLNQGVLKCTSRADPTRFEILLPIGPG